jgi:phosphatidylglycerophosphate synthase
MYKYATKCYGKLTMDREKFDSTKAQAKQYASETRGRATESLRGNIEEIDFQLGDLLMPPTLLTATGMKLVHEGSQDLSKIANVKKIRNGRLLDIADGIVARTLNMESDAGALADVTADKLEQLLVAIEAWKQDALPKSVISYLAIKNLAHTILTIAASLNHPGESFRTPQANKLAMFLENLGAGLLLEANAYEKELPDEGKHDVRRKIGTASLAISIVFELSALRTMTRRLDKNASL